MTYDGPWMINDVAKDTPYQYNGKELNLDHGLNWSDYEARWYDACLGRFTSVDPLAKTMPAWSPYIYTYNNPIRFTDPTGMAPETVKPGSAAALSMIKNTLTKADAQYVRLDNNGTIDKDYLNSNLSSSANYQRLSQLVNDDQIFEVNIASGFNYKDGEGNVQSTEFGSIFQGEPSESAFSPNTGEEGFFGVTQTPGKEANKYNSVDGNVHITVNVGLSESGRAQNFAHEGLGHGYLYSKGEDHRHIVKSTPEGFKETNKALAKNITEAVQETRNNLKDRNN